MAISQDQLTKIRTRGGFIAALDQSGGSTPAALRAYGVHDDAYDSDDEMFSIMHQMRARIIMSPAFDGERILGAILFENTLDRQIDGRGSADYLWKERNIVPFLKVDKGLADESDGVRLMKPIPDLAHVLKKAKRASIFGTKMRSVIRSANESGVASIANQQFHVGRQILSAGLMPIIEPEIDINAPDKAEAEVLLREQLTARLDELDAGQQVMFKLTLPDQPGFYRSYVEHPNVLKVVALSGGYTREKANRRLAQNPGVVASFSRALTHGLSIQQSDEVFKRALDASIEAIYQASCA